MLLHLIWFTAIALVETVESSNKVSRDPVGFLKRSLRPRGDEKPKTFQLTPAPRPNLIFQSPKANIISGFTRVQRQHWKVLQVRASLNWSVIQCTLYFYRYNSQAKSTERNAIHSHVYSVHRRRHTFRFTSFSHSFYYASTRHSSSLYWKFCSVYQWLPRLMEAISSNIYPTKFMSQCILDHWHQLVRRQWHVWKVHHSRCTG